MDDFEWFTLAITIIIRSCYDEQNECWPKKKKHFMAQKTREIERKIDEQMTIANQSASLAK